MGQSPSKEDAPPPSIPKITIPEEEPSSNLSLNASAPLNFPFSPSPPPPSFHDLELYDALGNKLVAFTVDCLLGEKECEKVIEMTEERGYGKALVNVGGGKQVLMDDVRKSDRFMSDDVEFAGVLLERLKKEEEGRRERGEKELFPLVYKEKEVSGLNERLRFLRYYKGGFFSQHNDGCYIRPGGKERSYITLQLYLNHPKQGGATTFFSVYTKNGARRGPVAVIPEPGKALIFQHNILHEGSELEEGVKYAMRTDVMYRVAGY